MSVSDKGLPLGILDQYVWAREVEELGKAEQRKKKATAQKESQRWLDALTKSEELLPASTEVVTIADREGDFYDFMKCPRRPASEFLIRASQNRCLESGKKLWSAVESTSIQGEMTVEVKGNPSRAARRATLSIRYTTVSIQPPQNRGKKEQLEPQE